MEEQFHDDHFDVLEALLGITSGVIGGVRWRSPSAAAPRHPTHHGGA
jgi:hypothetical protein